MKKITLLAACLFFILPVSNVFAMDMYIKIQYTKLPFEVSGLENVELTDYPQYTGSDEGRVALDLSDYNTTDPAQCLNIGIAFGGFDSTVLFDIESTVGLSRDALLFIEWVGIDLRYNNEYFFIGVSAKGGLGQLTLPLGTMYQISGYRAPVVLYEGSIYDGDSMNAELSGFAYKLGIPFGLKLGDSFAINGEVGLCGLYFGTMTATTSNDVEVDLENNSHVVETGGSYTQAYQDSSFSGNGQYITLGIEIKI